ncbi:MAG: hypothetical protein QFX36_06105 [Archaeoglobales archaeon]|nr:hypothetical protein [Archaeoglobales archaeon]
MKVLLEIIDDIENFIKQLEKRKEELEELKDQLLIFSDPEFIESIRRGLKDFEEGKIKSCKDLTEVRKLFENL